MNKKGFTLIELLAIIVVIGIILAIAVPSIIKVVNKNNERELELKKETILSAAELYGQDYPSIYDANFKATITVRELLENGYLDADVSNNTKNCENEEKGCIINPVTKDSINDEIIYIMKSTMKIQAIWEGDFPSITFDKLTFTLKYNVESSEFKYPEDYDLLKGVETNMNIEDVVITNEGELVNENTLEPGNYTLTYTVGDTFGNIISKNRIVNIIIPSKEFAYKEEDQEYEVIVSGTYIVEAWGAQGGSYGTKAIGGKGGYIKAEVNLNAGDTLIINTGGINGYNGGGTISGGQPGGGSTTTRKDGEYLVIAAGGGASGLYNSTSYIGGSGGSGDGSGGAIARTGGTAGVTGTNGGGGSSSLNKTYSASGDCKTWGTCQGSCISTGQCYRNVCKTWGICKICTKYDTSQGCIDAGDCKCIGTWKDISCCKTWEKEPYECCKEYAPSYNCCTESYPSTTETAYGKPGNGGTSSIVSEGTLITKTDGEHSGNGYLIITYKIS